MKNFKLRTLIFLALCCDFGLFAKKIISPLANVITDALHIPGGIGTSFSLMFLVVAAVLVPRFGCGTIMATVQSALALSFGMVGSMGALAPIGYILPGITIDLVLFLTERLSISNTDRMLLTNMCAAVCASLTANIIVFHLHGAVLLLYVCVAATSGAICGVLGSHLSQRLMPVIGTKLKQENRKNLEVSHEK